MKTAILITIFTIFLGNVYSQTSNQNQSVKSEFRVSGLCGMCKTRIEKAAKVEGVTSAVWDNKTMLLKIQYIPSKIKLETIHQNIAKAGHDTEKVKADNAVYNNFPACCKYERSTNQAGHKH